MSDKWSRTLEPYKHDCGSCIWVGWIEGLQGMLGNMYFCPPKSGASSRKYGSIIIRYGDDPSAYWSAPIGCCQKGPIGVTEEKFAEHKKLKQEWVGGGDSNEKIK